MNTFLGTQVSLEQLINIDYSTNYFIKLWIEEILKKSFPFGVYHIISDYIVCVKDPWWSWIDEES